MKYYKCDICGNLFEVVNDSKVVPICCGQEMNKLKANGDDSASKEKHVPEYEVKDNYAHVYVGSEPHPMTDEHYIDWIEIYTDKGMYRKNVKDSKKAEATFILDDDETIQKVYAFCNLHGLWVAK